VRFADFTNSTWGRVAIALAIFLAGYYFPLFGLFGGAKAPDATASATASGPAR
jgi:hypothetical protein